MENDAHIILDKQLRRDIDAIIQRLKDVSEPIPLIPKPTIRQLEELLENRDLKVAVNPDGTTTVAPAKVRCSEWRTEARRHLQYAVMCLGMDLKELGTPNPYPNSKDPSNTIVEPTADGLKL